MGVLYSGLIFFSQALYGVVFVITRDSRLAWMSIGFDLNQLGDFLFSLPLRQKMPVSVAFLAIAALIGLSAAILARRVRAVEVVG